MISQQSYIQTERHTVSLVYRIKILGNTALDMALMKFQFLVWDSDKEKEKEKAAEILKEYGEYF